MIVLFTPPSLQWLRDRQPALTSKDLGRNEDSAAKLLKKLEEVGRNVDNFGKTVTQLDKQKKALLDQKNVYGQGSNKIFCKKRIILCCIRSIGDSILKILQEFAI